MNHWMTIIISLLFALVMTLVPMPDWTIWCRPAWVLLVLIYWATFAPFSVSVGMAWTMGIIMDLLTGTVLGEHALAFTVIIYFVSKMHLRLGMYPLLQQTLSVFLFVLLYQLILYCMQGFIGDLPASALYWLASFTSVCLWPWLFIILRDCQRRFRVT